METGVVFNIQKYSIQDGPGIRTTVFLKGCPLSCWWCHNPESQTTAAEIAVLVNRCIRCGECLKACPSDVSEAGNSQLSREKIDRCALCGECVGACPTGARQMVGERMTVAEVLAEVLRDRVFYEDSGGGVTFSGGEPLLQPKFLLELLKACRAQAIRTALDTSGYAPLEHLVLAAEHADLILYDLKLIDDARHRQFTGVSNAIILDNLKALGRIHSNLWIRVPVIPGVNDSADDMSAIAEFATSVSGVRQVNLLPYHATAADKSRRFGKPDRLGFLSPTSRERLRDLAAMFRTCGLTVVIGG